MKRLIENIGICYLCHGIYRISAHPVKKSRPLSLHLSLRPGLSCKDNQSSMELRSNSAHY